MQQFLDFLGKNASQLTLLSALLGAVFGALWKVYIYFHNKSGENNSYKTSTRNETTSDRRIAAIIPVITYPFWLIASSIKVFTHIILGAFAGFIEGVIIATLFTFLPAIIVSIFNRNFSYLIVLFWVSISGVVLATNGAVKSLADVRGSRPSYRYIVGPLVGVVFTLLTAIFVQMLGFRYLTDARFIIIIGFVIGGFVAGLGDGHFLKY